MITLRLGSNYLILLFETIKLIVRNWCLLYGYEVKDYAKRICRAAYQVNGHIIKYLKFEVLFNVKHTSVVCNIWPFDSLDLWVTKKGLYLDEKYHGDAFGH